MRVLLGPLINLVLRFIPAGDPWERFAQRVPLSLYGSGSLRDFGWYLEGESRVAVASIEEIHHWLPAASTWTTRSLFHENDFWQHPRTFEHLPAAIARITRLGLRKLVELGVDRISCRSAAFRTGVSEAGSGHVWVVFTRGEETMVFETVAKTKEGMLRPLREVRDQYRPEVAVNGVRKRFAYRGYLLTLKEQRDRGRAFRAAALAVVLFCVGACARERPPQDADTQAAPPSRPAPFAFDSAAVVVRGAFRSSVARIENGSC